MWNLTVNLKPLRLIISSNNYTVILLDLPTGHIQ